MRTSYAEASERLGRITEPLGEMKERLTGAVSGAQTRLIGARDTAEDAIAEKPFRYTLVAFALGMIVGLALGAQRRDGY